MATKRGLERVIERLSVSITKRVAQVTEEEVVDRANRTERLMQKVYLQFFDYIDLDIIGQSSGDIGQTPKLIKSFMGGEGQWKKLTDDWRDRKDIPRVNRKGGRRSFNELPHGYYQGLTEYYSTTTIPRRSKRGGKRSRSLAKRLSFQQYIRGLSDDPGAVERFFGPLGIEYAVGERSRNFKIVKQDGLIKEIETRSKKTGKFLMFPRDVSLRATITAFPRLNGVQFSEWYVVDRMMAKAGAANKKQWMKVNSQYSFGVRPIRAMITPLISYYGHVAFKEVTRKLFTGYS
jgi:hypothetical protein